MKSKWMKIMMVLMVTMFAASTAFATIELSSRSEEMTAFSSCDQAGSITLAFTAADYALISTHLATNNYVRIRATLTGTDIDPGATPPTLCKAISNAANDGTGVGALGGDFPSLPLGQGYVLLDETDIEVSDLGGVAANDITAYVYGAMGSRYFDVYITAMEDPAVVGDNPWIKVGLYDELVGADKTSICAQVSAFGGLSKLTVSYNFIPTSLTINSADNEIGHFLEDVFALRDCVKGETCIQASTSSIELCPIGGIAGQETCPNYYKCAVVEGDFPTGDDVKFYVRTNGAVNNANTQVGVYIVSVTLIDGDGDALPLVGAAGYYRADGITAALHGDCDFLAKHFTATVHGDDITTNGNAVQYCIVYQVDPSVAVSGTDVKFWIEANTLPCGSLYTDTITAASLIDCATTPYCMYFPYVLSGISPWATGLVVTNLGATDAADMEVTFTLVDSTGAVFTATKNDFTSVVYSVTMDNLNADLGWAPAPGNALLKVQSNFVNDGYSYLTNGTFGAGTLPRLQQSCGTITSLR